MKILCDVCGADEAAVFCCADEAALCCCCDRRVHRANKLAGKHTRLSLLSSSPQPNPLCDICQERRGFVFCREDRAILCCECDSSVHAANGLTKKHSRFILTGTRISPASITASSSSSSPSSERSISEKKVSASFSLPVAECSGSGSGSSISEYLIKMLPGYRFEDFLLEDSINYTAGDVFCQSDALAPLVEADMDAGVIGVALMADWNFCVPDAPLHVHRATSVIPAAGAATGVVNVVKESSNEEMSRAQQFLDAPLISHHGREQWTTDQEVFAVPQLPCVPRSNKRPAAGLRLGISN